MMHLATRTDLTHVRFVTMGAAQFVSRADVVRTVSRQHRSHSRSLRIRIHLDPWQSQAICMSAVFF
jgi:hypothetical protein